MAPPTVPRWYSGAVVAGYAALLCLLLWSRSLSAGWLAAAVAATVLSLLLTYRAPGNTRRDPPKDLLYLAVAVLAVALLTTSVTQQRLRRVARSWDQVMVQRETRRAAGLQRRMAGVLERGGRVTERAAAVVAAAGPEPTDLFDRLETLRARSAVEALVLIDRNGAPLAWAGDHRGRIPVTVREGEGEVAFSGGPLFRYLYFLRPIPGRAQHVAAAVLLETDLPGGAGASGFAARFEAATGDRPRFERGADPGAAWRLVQDGRVVVHARFQPPDQGETRTAIATTGRRLVSFMLVLVFGLLAAAWLRPTRHRRGAASLAPLAAMALVLLTAPLGRTLGLQRLFSPAMFVLPLPGDLVLESVLVFLLPAAALMATYRPPVREGRAFLLRVAVGTLLVAVGFGAGMTLLQSSAGPALLQGGAGLWVAFQATALLLLTVVAMAAFPRGRGIPTRYRLTAGIGAAVAVVGLVLLVIAAWRSAHVVEPLLLALWAVPFALLAIALAPYEGRGHRLVRWLAAGWLAATAVVPHVWTMSGERRLDVAEQELATLGARSDPYLDFLLRRFAEEVVEQRERGLEGTQLLYEAWLASDELAREPYPLHVTLWDRSERVVVELPLGGTMAPAERTREPPGFLALIMSVARERGTAQARPVDGVPGVIQALAVPLPDGRTVTVVVAPRRSFERASPLSAFLGGGAGGEASLELIPASAVRVTAAGAVHWEATDEGWRSKTVVPYPTATYHAHLAFRLPPPGVRFARGILVIAADLVLLLLLWALGRLGRGDAPVPPGGWVGWLASFRARVTLALFAFFLLPTVVFGWAAYQALAGEVTRSARNVAERAVTQAAAGFPATDLPELAARLGEDVLYHFRGELIEASSPETLDLGLYGAWMPADLRSVFRTGDEVAVVDAAELAGRSYLVAYRREVPAGTLGVPVWLETGDVAIRQEELAHVLLFTALLGGLLSLALSVVVGRTLARPLGELRRAAAAVGAGRLGVRLDEDRDDEFGQLFASFNNMTRRLRRARARELHTARVLAWGQMARQVAHEIKNPLTPIKLAVQHIQRVHADRRGDFDQVLEENVEEILNEIERLSEIARVFSRYGAPAEAAGPLTAVDVPTVVRESMTLYVVGDEGIDYRLDVADDVPPARARPAELKEVMLNLLENARTAIQGRGTVRVRVDAEREVVRVHVEDDGVGIPPRLLPQIFEPHFSTESAGTGLGLAIVRRLVEGWGGGVRARSERDVGTTITLEIPAAADEATD